MLLLDLPQLCQLKVLRFLDDQSLRKLKRTNRQMYTTIGKNRIHLVGRRFRSIFLDMRRLDKVPVVCRYLEMTIFHKEYEFRNMGEKYIQVATHQTNEIIIFGRMRIARSCDIVKEKNKFIKTTMPNGDIIYSKTGKRREEMIVITNNLRATLQECMKRELENIHFDSIKLLGADAEIVAFFPKIRKLNINQVVIDQPEFNRCDATLVRCLRHMGTAELTIVPNGMKQNVVVSYVVKQMFFHKEFIEFMPSLCAFYCSPENRSSRTNVQTEVDILAVAPKTIMINTIALPMDNIRKIIEDWYYGRSHLDTLRCGTFGLSIGALSASLRIPHTLRDDKISIPSKREGEWCSVSFLFHLSLPTILSVEIDAITGEE